MMSEPWNMFSFAPLPTTNALIEFIIQQWNGNEILDI